MKKIISYIMFVMFMVTTPLFANDIYVTQSGASLTLDVLQDGEATETEESEIQDQADEEIDSSCCEGLFFGDSELDTHPRASARSKAPHLTDQDL